MTTLRELMGRITQGDWGRWSSTGTLVLDTKRKPVASAEYRNPTGPLTAEEHANTDAIALLPELLALAAAVVDLEEKAAAYQKATTGPERNCTWSAVEMARKIKFDALSALQAKLEAK